MSVEKFDAKDICAIIESCARCHVTELRLSGMVVSFGQRSTAIEQAQRDGASQLPPLITEQATPTEIGALSNKNLSQPKVDLATAELLEQIELQQKMISDPLGFEQHILDSHLNTGETYAQSGHRHSQPDVSGL